jgi:hypothetical protein
LEQDTIRRRCCIFVRISVLTLTDDDSDVDKDNVASAAVNGAVFVMCHGAILNCMPLRTVGMVVDAYGKSREYAMRRR